MLNYFQTCPPHTTLERIDGGCDPARLIDGSYGLMFVLCVCYVIGFIDSTFAVCVFSMVITERRWHAASRCVLPSAALSVRVLAGKYNKLS